MPSVGSTFGEFFGKVFTFGHFSIGLQNIIIFIIGILVIVSGIYYLRVPKKISKHIRPEDWAKYSKSIGLLQCFIGIIKIILTFYYICGMNDIRIMCIHSSFAIVLLVILVVLWIVHTAIDVKYRMKN